MTDIDIPMEDFLEHFGVKGMKWGVRRKARGPASEDAQRHGANRKKHVSELSDRELRELVGRMNMEQQRNKMNPTTIKGGLVAVAGILAIGKTVNEVIQFANTPAGAAIAKRLTRRG